ncbi:MAG: dienelactone hydrolase family protein [Tepidisphaeraceae bacterium]
MTLKGFLAYDDAIEGKRPGVVVMHEWLGLNDYVKDRARQLAQLGYVAFAPDIYGDGFATADVKVAGQKSGEARKAGLLRTRGLLGLEQLKKNDKVDATKTAAIGYCFGGATALEIARGGGDVSGIVSFHGALGTANPAQPGAVKAKVLVCHGGADPFVPPAELEAFEKEMKNAKVDYTVIQYPDAQHAFTNPDVDKANLDGAKYNKAADEKSWRDMKAFFAELFGASAPRAARCEVGRSAAALFISPPPQPQRGKSDHCQAGRFRDDRPPRHDRAGEAQAAVVAAGNGVEHLTGAPAQRQHLFIADSVEGGAEHGSVGGTLAGQIDVEVALVAERGIRLAAVDLELKRLATEVGAGDRDANAGRVVEDVEKKPAQRFEGGGTERPVGGAPVVGGLAAGRAVIAWLLAGQEVGGVHRAAAGELDVRRRAVGDDRATVRRGRAAGGLLRGRVARQLAGDAEKALRRVNGVTNEFGLRDPRATEQHCCGG